MSDQLALDGFGAAPQPTDGLYFALFPDAETAAAMARLTQTVCAAQGLSGWPVKAARLHLTLHELGEHVGVPEPLVRAALAAAGQVQASAFELSLDRLLSFRGGHGKRTLVLRGAGDDLALHHFHGELGAVMARTPGLSRWAGKPFTPHVTLHYGRQAVDEQAISPMRWTAAEFVLIHSTLDRGGHNILGRWPLVPP
jgi:2'-5' RNA ligase